jgi:hypothetical protein
MYSKRPRRDPVGGRERIRAGFDKWWLLPFCILAASALTALSIIVFRPSFIDHSGGAAFLQARSDTATDCSGLLAFGNGYSCYQKRYQDLVYDSGVEAAFAALKDESSKERFVKDNCHQLTHVIGRAAANLYADEVASTYSRGDDFCGSGYYHGAMETIVANIGAENVLDEADGICADVREQQNRSLNHRNCAHGLGHGFMGLYQNELFEALQACDPLPEEWEREHCSGGVFMQNMMDEDNPSNPSKYLKADRPFYPCTEVKSEYKPQCYSRHTAYALKVQGNDFAEVFDLCGKVEDGFRSRCYVGLGNKAADQSTSYDATEGAQAEYIRERCMQGQGAEARFMCFGGAARNLIFLYDGDVQAKALCESLTRADWRAGCHKEREGYMAQRRRT